MRRSLVKGSCMATVLKSLQAINSLDAKLEASTKKASAKNAAAATKSKAKEWSQLLSWKSGTNRKTAWSTVCPRKMHVHVFSLCVQGGLSLEPELEVDMFCFIFPPSSIPVNIFTS